MSRKNLARTVIEGGRYFHNGFERRYSHRSLRVQTREWLSHLDDPDASAIEPLEPVPRRFRDKLAPAWRWLDSQCGRPWDKVRGELVAKFDARTTAGRHVLHDHMLKDVEDGNRDYRIDDYGILRHRRWFGLDERHLRVRVRDWRAGRRAVSTPIGWHWIRLVATGPRCITCYRDIPHVGPDHHVVRFVDVAPLTKGEVRFLGRLPDWAYWEVVVRKR